MNETEYLKKLSDAEDALNSVLMLIDQPNNNFRFLINSGRETDSTEDLKNAKQLVTSLRTFCELLIRAREGKIVERSEGKKANTKYINELGTGAGRLPLCPKTSFRITASLMRDLIEDTAIQNIIVYPGIHMVNVGTPPKQQPAFTLIFATQRGGVEDGPIDEMVLNEIDPCKNCTPL